MPSTWALVPAACSASSLYTPVTASLFSCSPLLLYCLGLYQELQLCLQQPGTLFLSFSQLALQKYLSVSCSLFPSHLPLGVHKNLPSLRPLIMGFCFAALSLPAWAQIFFYYSFTSVQINGPSQQAHLLCKFSQIIATSATIQANDPNISYLYGSIIFHS